MGVQGRYGEVRRAWVLDRRRRADEERRYVKTAESLTCHYVWGRYDVLVLPASFPYGGMENSNLTFVRSLFLASIPPSQR